MSDAREIAEGLGKTQRRVILSLGPNWGSSADYQCAKRMWYGIRGGYLLIDHKHRTDNCWRLRPLGLAVRKILEDSPHDR